ncbi:MAG: hypothetical protein M1817_006079 [Caeruleum heppii]|nr:MAG: hypothetical protein M1817_006079 [Caeruleum heppii]
MSSTQTSLDGQVADRKARLAKLKSLKRKQPTEAPSEESAENDPSPEPTDVTTQYLSGRNYDPTTRGPKLGFETAPNEGEETLEDRAEAIAQETTRTQAEEEQADRPIDLFKLQPKKPNWDLKRDLDRKLEVLNVRTENAIARLVRQRIEEQQRKANGGQEAEKAAVDGVTIGMEGTTLVEGVHLREKEEEEEERRDREDDEMS